MIDLIENIVIDDFVEANEIFESRIAEIAEKKLYEFKRSIDITEIVKPVKGRPGEFTGVNTPKDWARYRKQTKLPKHEPAEPAPAEFGSGKRLSKGDIERRRKAGYLQAHPAIYGTKFIQAVHKFKKTGKIDESTRLGPESIRYEPARKAAQAELEPDMSAVIKHVEKSEKEKAKAKKLDAKKPWHIRNLNTLLGRDPDYDRKAPENKSRGGRAGSFVRGAIGRVGSEIASYSNLEE